MDIRPHRNTTVGDIDVSSVNYYYGILLLDETCIFYPDGNSKVVGTYNDHDKIVEQIKNNQSK